MITSYPTCASEHGAYDPSSSNATSKKSSKKKADSDDELDSDDDPFSRAASKKKPARAKAKKDALFRVHWHRIVLGAHHCFFDVVYIIVLTVDIIRRGS